MSSFSITKCSLKYCGNADVEERAIVMTMIRESKMRDLGRRDAHAVEFNQKLFEVRLCKQMTQEKT